MNPIPRYLHYKSLGDWEEDDVVLVELIDSENADVRTHYPNRRSGKQPVEEAFDEAHRIKRQDPHINDIGVYLNDGVVWSGVWGDLIPPPHARR